jgi:flagellar assembly protein FliH
MNHTEDKQSEALQEDNSQAPDYDEQEAPAAQNQATDTEEADTQDTVVQATDKPAQNGQPTTNQDYMDVKLWDLPSVDDATVIEEGQTNAFKKPLGRWKFEAPEQEQEEDLKPLTAEDIEAIRKAAFDEGLAMGKEEGFAQGHEQGLESGKQEGLELGKEEGISQGKAQADEEAKVQLDALKNIVEQLQSPLAELQQELKNELLLLAVSLAKAVLKVELSQSNESLLQAINEGIAVLPMQENAYQLHLHVDDMSALQAHMGEQAIENKHWQFIACAEMQRGGCKIVSQNNAVDMSIARRSEQVFGQVLLNQGLADDPRAD